MRPLGLYLHIPFCKAKCIYCDFYSLPHSEEKMDAYTAALQRDLIRWADQAKAIPLTRSTLAAARRAISAQTGSAAF